MTSQFPSLNHPSNNPAASYTLSQAMQQEMFDDYNKNELVKRRRAALTLNKMSFVGSTTTCERWIDERLGVAPAHLCPPSRDFREGRGPYVVNGVPISRATNGCCVKDPCLCGSDVIFYNGHAYDQKPFLKARLITRPGNVMYLEGKLTPPFNPGKSPHIYGPYTKRGKRPMTMCFNENRFGKSLSRCCTTSTYGDNIPPYHSRRARELAFTDAGLPFGDTIGYFRFKPNKVCARNQAAVTKMTECCICEQGEYNPAQYAQDECPTFSACC
ncbi:hypothetical protein ElyMa_004089300 [Elysia marginata]|uniref:Uncharacterized protein n=1 Tax=Elysia marginata TaxID=1093978 RepID=A0AAV4GCA8_9GAST|nr:hypothetical protein ElyMa_004089300 [Elysia marginata]